jgi:hypothetical protein
MIYFDRGRITLNSAKDHADYSFSDGGVCRLFCIMMFYNYLSSMLYNIVAFVTK